MYGPTLSSHRRCALAARRYVLSPSRSEAELQEVNWVVNTLRKLQADPLSGEANSQLVTSGIRALVSRLQA